MMGEIIKNVLEVNVIIIPLVLLLFLFGSLICKRYGAKCLRILWIILMVRLFIPVNLSLGIINIQLPLFDTVNESSTDTKADTINPIEEPELTDTVPPAYEPEQADNAGEAETPTDSTSKKTPDTYDAATVSPIESSAESAGGASYIQGSQISQNDKNTETNTGNNITAVTEKKADINLYTLILSIWITGCVIFLALRIIQYIQFYKEYYTDLQLCTNKKLVIRIKFLEKKYLGHCNIKIYQKEDIASPMLVGCIHPKLVVPADLTDIERLELIVKHELCHYKNRDLWIKLLMAAVQIIYWYNPCVYLMKREMFASMELACDSYVLECADEDIREAYARLVLSFADKRNIIGVFGTGFHNGKRNMKKRIDNMMDGRKKKKGTVIFAFLLLVVMAAGLVVSCGIESSKENKASQENEQQNMNEQQNAEEEAQKAEEEMKDYAADQESVQNEMQQSEEEMKRYEQAAYANANLEHGYNRRIRIYNGTSYIATKKGIYCISADGQESLIYENEYASRTSIALYNHYLYFSGTREDLTEESGIIYRMDLDTKQVEALSEPIETLSGVYVYDDCLYAAKGYVTMVGYELNEDGSLGAELDNQSEDFLYYEYNEYMNLENQLMQTEVDSAEWEAVWNEKKQLYQAIVDVATAKRMLQGNQIVAQYKDEITNCLYVEDEDGNYNFLCDVYAGEAMVTDKGVYYWKNGESICFTDYSTGTEKVIYDGDGVPSFVTYDWNYIYYTLDLRDGMYLMRQPLEGGEQEQIADEQDLGSDTIRTLSVTTRYAIDNEYFYIIDYEGDIDKIPLPAATKKLSGQEPEDAAQNEGRVTAPTREEVDAARNTALSGMSQEDVDRLTENIKVANLTLEHAYLDENIFTKLDDKDSLYWNYIDEAGEIQIGWQYDGNEDVAEIRKKENLTMTEFFEKYGTPVYAYNRFDADNFIELMEDMKLSINNEDLKADIDQLIFNMQQAKDTHEMEYVNQIYRILHDMDYYLLRYGPEDVAPYTSDSSLVYTFYNSLNIYK